MSNGRVVYQTRPQRAKPRRNPYAEIQVVRDADGKPHAYLNCAKPERYVNPQHVAICPRCGFGYTAMLLYPERVCPECRMEEVAAAGERLERQGVPMGWGVFDPRGHCEYEHAHRKWAGRTMKYPHHLSAKSRTMRESIPLELDDMR